MATNNGVFSYSGSATLEHPANPVDGEVCFNTAGETIQVYTPDGGGWVDVGPGGAADHALSAGGNAVVAHTAGDIAIDGNLSLPDDTKIKYQEPEEYEVGDLVCMREWAGGKTFGVVDWVGDTPGLSEDTPTIQVRWDHVEDGGYPPLSVTKNQIERQRDTALMYDLMQKKIDEGRHKVRIGDAVTHPMYQQSFGVVQDDPQHNNGWANILWKECPFGMPNSWTDTAELEAAPLGTLLEDHMEKAKQEQEIKFDEQETKLILQETKITDLENDKTHLRDKMIHAESETDTLKTRFDLVLKRIEQLEGVGQHEEALEVERTSALPVLASMSKRQRIKTIAGSVIGVVGKQVAARIVNQSGLPQWIISLFTGS